MSLIIKRIRHYNTPSNHREVVEGIVQAPSNRWVKTDRLPYHKYHHRDRYWQCYTAESASSNRCSLHPHRCCDEHRAQQIVARFMPTLRKLELVGVLDRGDSGLVPLLLYKGYAAW